MRIATLAAVFGAALVAASLFVPAARAVALRLGAVDCPGKRRAHRQSTPRLGGIAVVVGALAGLLAGLVFLYPELIPAGEHAHLAIVLTATAVAVLGFLDDIRGLSPRVKLLGEVGLAIILFGTGLRIERIEVPILGVLELGGAASLAATVLWMVAVTNAFNLVDGVNGLAAGVGGITALGLVALGLVAEAPVVVILAAALAGALFAFLRDNLRPGRIFLGDSGSLFLGFVLAAVTVQLGQRAGRPVFPGVGVLLMGLPLVEIVTTVVRRTLRSRALRLGPAGVVSFLRRELMHPDLGHLHHCLIRRGVRAEATADFLVGIAAVYCLASVILFAIPSAEAPASLAAIAVTALCLAVCRPLARRPHLELVVPAAGAASTVDIATPMKPESIEIKSMEVESESEAELIAA